nr:hypothetical protein CFP56_42796 [Quercus suber]
MSSEVAMEVERLKKKLGQHNQNCSSCPLQVTRYYQGIQDKLHQVLVAIGSFAVCKVSPTPVHTVADPISSKLAAVHHVSQAISSLRQMRQLQSTELELEDVIETNDKLPSSIYFSVCACGDADCIEVCNIQEWLPTSKLDHKLWKLVLLLGEFYLALGQAYKEDGQLNQALKVAELACSIYGSIPQHHEDRRSFPQ